MMGEESSIMPPMSSPRTFIAALKTGETRTTKALEEVTGRRQGVKAEALLAALKRRRALKSPLAEPLREAIQRKTRLPDRYIDRCIDAWPEKHKEDARKAIVRAFHSGKRLRFRWGLKSGQGFDAVIRDEPDQITITALSPRSTLRVAKGGEIYVAPGYPPTKKT
jgi:hypothetical protein